MNSLDLKKQKYMTNVVKTANDKRLSLLPTNNNLDHVSWSAMTILIIKYRDGKTTEREDRHILNMAAHLGLEPEQFIMDMENRIESGLIMATGTLIGVSTAAKMIEAADTEEGLDAAFLYYNQYMNFF
jgi:hypothetical protein